MTVLWKQKNRKTVEDNVSYQCLELDYNIKWVKSFDTLMSLCGACDIVLMALTSWNDQDLWHTNIIIVGCVSLSTA